jgi:FkbH-like protein
MSQDKLIVSATFTADLLRDSLEFWNQKLDAQLNIEFSSYNQVFQELLNPSSATRKNPDGINIVLLKFDDWLRYRAQQEEQEENVSSDSNPESETSEEQLRHQQDLCQAKVKRNVEELSDALQTAASESSIPYVVCICPASPNQLSDDFVDDMTSYLIEQSSEINNIYWITSSDVNNLYPVPSYYNQYTDKLGHIPFIEEFFAAIGTIIFRKIRTLKQPARKVIVLDCDQTIWSGICGEDGTLGVRVDESRQVLQKFMLAQMRKGMLLCLCSKNSENDVIEVFHQHPDMLMKLKDIVAWRINWQRKSDNIKSLAKELNLGLDSFIFIDDNPVECSEVQLNCPEVLTLRLPSKVAEIPGFLKHIWAFDHIKVTNEDSKRTEYYKQNVKRERVRQSSLKFSDFLKELQLDIKVSEVQPNEVFRVSQLTQRTNQFNATTIRRSEAEVVELLQDPRSTALAVTVKDKFGDYGLVGVVLALKDSPNQINVDTFLLSCRVLGRGVEHRMLNHLADLSKAAGIERILFPFILTAKNQPVSDFLTSIGQNFLKPSSEGVIYDFPVEFVSQITYTLESQSDEVESTEPDVSQLSSQSEGKLSSSNQQSNVSETESKQLLSGFKQMENIQEQVLFEIANQLQSAQAILSAVKESLRDSPLKSGNNVRPSNQVEMRLEAIWKDILNTDKIGITDNFFDLGGTSILSVLLLFHIEKEFGCQLPLTVLLENNTIEKLAELIRKPKTESAKSNFCSLVSIRSIPDSDKLPVFMVHGGFGDVLYYQGLLPFWANDQPFYGFQPVGLNNDNKPLDKVELMASHYISELRQVQPEGPYFLGGRCMGAIIALEMAQQLEADGQEVKLIALLQPAFPAPMEQFTFWKNRISYYFQHYFLISFSYHFATFMKLNAKSKLGYALTQTRKVIFRAANSFSISSNSFRKIFPQKSKSNQKPSSETHASDKDLFESLALKEEKLVTHASKAKSKLGNQASKNRVFEANMNALRRYTPAPYLGNAKVALFIAEETSRVDLDKSHSAWTQLVKKNLDYHSVPGNYDTMTSQKYAQKLTGLIQSYLTANVSV